MFLKKIKPLKLIVFSLFILVSIFFAPLLFINVSALTKNYPVVVLQGHDVDVKFQAERPWNWVSLPEMSRVALAAIIISEDSNFWHHHGYDTEQMRKALRANWKAKKYVRGASTITQQVAKNLFLYRKKSLERKMKELLVAFQLERKLSKSRILEIYINIAEWGPGIYGIKNAAQFYFNKSPVALTAKEGAFLAMLLPSPKRYSRAFQMKGLTSYAARRIEDILEKLYTTHHLSQEDFARELEKPL